VGSGVYCTEFEEPGETVDGDVPINRLTNPTELISFV
jgi:hypothetical protein